MSDPVHHPVHYANSPAKCLGCGRSIECIDVAEHWGFNLGNALKYLWRAGKKGSAKEDLRKAIWYIQRQIDRLDASEKVEENKGFSTSPRNGTFF
jgi:hypothetical protein